MTASVLDAQEQASRLGTVNVLSTFSPSIDGIARYADQFVAALARDGARVTRIGLPYGGGGGDEIVDIARGARYLRVIRRTPRGRVVFVMWHEHYLTPGRQLARIAAVASFAIGFRLRRTVVMPHEVAEDLVSGTRGLRRLARSVEELLRRAMWRGVAEIWFLSEFERDAFGRRNPTAVANATLSVVSHGKEFAPEIDLTQEQARQRLGVPSDEQLFLCLGFLSVHKGIDRVLRAFAVGAPTGSRLWIVGGAMKSDEQTSRHIEELHRTAATMANVEMSERFVDNEEFDIWLRAADYVVLAYRSAASSSVIPRAQLMGARVIGSGVGGTGEQLRPGIDIVARDEDALVRAFRAVGREGGS
jgi:glycosyltransferase involved in cell wall biosynthesis